MAKNRQEAVTASFHYLLRHHYTEDKELKISGFKLEEFNQIFEGMANQPKLDLSNKEQFDRVKYGSYVPFSKIKRVNERCIFGVYEGAYWGHSFKNSHKGEISAESLNQRKFHFILYLAESGRLYIGSQYLGNFGHYDSLRRTLTGMMSCPETVQPHTFRTDSIDPKGIVAKEIKITVSKLPASIASRNIFDTNTVIAAKKGRKDESFDLQLRERIFPYLASPVEKRREILAKFLSEGELFDIKDSDIENCSIIASVSGRDKIIYFLGNNNFATKFELDVNLGEDGHPLYEDTQKQMYEVLAKQIVVRKEDD